MVKYLFTCLIIFFSLKSNCAFAQESSPCGAHLYSSKFFFKKDSSYIDKMYMSNSKTLGQLDDFFTNNNILSNSDTLTITATSSPDGLYGYNLKLAQSRVLNLKQLLLNRYPVLDSLVIQTGSTVIDWYECKSLIKDDLKLPYRSEVLEIIDQNNGVESVDLKKLRNGEPWKYIENNILPYFRSGNITIRLKIEAPSMDSALYKSTVSTLTMQSTIIDSNILKPRSINTSLDLSKGAKIKKSLNIRFALKTNLLYDVLLTPNVALEIPIGNHWSIQGEWIFPWWVSGDNSNALQLLAGDIEGRYWFGTKENRSNRQLFTGHFIGLYASAGIYDFQNDWGYQGEFNKSIGISYGYGLRLSNSFNLEFSIGVGYLSTDYSKYKLKNNELIWQSDNSYTWIGPTKAKVSIVWLIGNKKRGGDR